MTRLILYCASVDNHISRDNIFDYHPLRECYIYILQGANNKAADQTARMRMLVCTIVVRIQQNIFSRRGPFDKSHH